ncbi:hypothetical protein PALI_a6003 [Pseudoalteromonas aliena SW19]|uniref:Uncharacterized protein n=1 Tax=Pseudoalteromonas aliena SW19 TaxID=1314866 RepID=A0ABR9DUU4_9GAMM|nr:hypothetical protein [Pseudoalteromonas aliena SW19]
MMILKRIKIESILLLPLLISFLYLLIDPDIDLLKK